MTDPQQNISSHAPETLKRLRARLTMWFWIMMIFPLALGLALVGYASPAGLITWPVYIVAAIFFLREFYRVELALGRTTRQAGFNTVGATIAVLFVPIIGILIAAAITNDSRKKLHAAITAQSTST